MTEARDFAERRWLALGLLCVAQFVVVLDASIVNVALPSIGKALDFSQENLSWVVNAYVLTFGGFLLLGGRLADLLGRRRVFMVGLVLFALASLAGGFANSEGMLIAARAVQGLGAAILSPAALSIVTTTFRDGAERNKALGVWGAVAGSRRRGRRAARRRPDRRARLGVGAVGQRPDRDRPRRVARARADRREPLRVRDARTSTSPARSRVTAGLSLLVYALVDATDAGWGSTQTIGLLALSAALLGGLRRRSSCARAAPLVPFRIFRLRTLTGANVVGLLDRRVAVLDVLLHLAVHAAGARLQRDQGRPLVPAAGADDHRRGRRRLAARDAGRLQAGAGRRAWRSSPPGSIWFGQVSVGGSFLTDILGPSLLAAIGLGFSFVPITIAAVSGVDEHEAGLASGLINTSQQVGGALGLAILATVANSTHRRPARREPAARTRSPRASRPRSWPAPGSRSSA